MDNFIQIISGWWFLAGIAMFIAIVLWVFRSSAKKRLEKHGEIPLKRD